MTTLTGWLIPYPRYVVYNDPVLWNNYYERYDKLTVAERIYHNLCTLNWDTYGDLSTIPIFKDKKHLEKYLTKLESDAKLRGIDTQPIKNIQRLWLYV